MEIVGKRLRSQRKRNKLTLGQVSQYEGLSVQYLSDLERGRNSPAVWDLLQRLARRYHTTTDYLLGLSEDWRPGGTDVGLNEEEEQLLALWRSLDHEQQAYVVETIEKLQRWSRPRIIGGEEE